MGEKLIWYLLPLGFFIAFLCSVAAFPDEPTVVLAIGESAKVFGTEASVSFVDVVEDSRCPTGTDCIWAGDAVVRVRLDMPNIPQSSYALHANKEFGHEIVLEGARILLVSLAPYPTADAVPRHDKYRITLLFKRK